MKLEEQKKALELFQLYQIKKDESAIASNKLTELLQENDGGGFMDFNNPMPNAREIDMQVIKAEKTYQDMLKAWREFYDYWQAHK